MKKDKDQTFSAYISIPEYAKQAGVSRITIYNRVKSGQISAKKVGRNYVILRDSGDSSGIVSPLEEQKHISIAQLAKQLGISRIAVFQRIKSGKIPAQKVGRNYIIATGVLPKLKKKPIKEPLTDVKRYMSIPQLAKEMGVSRIDIYNKVCCGQIKAEKVGRNFIVDRQEIVKGQFLAKQKPDHISDEYISIPELAKHLGVSRITVYMRVKRGEIKAQKIGRNYVIPKKEWFKNK